MQSARLENYVHSELLFFFEHDREYVVDRVVDNIKDLKDSGLFGGHAYQLHVLSKAVEVKSVLHDVGDLVQVGDHCI